MTSDIVSPFCNMKMLFCMDGLVLCTYNISLQLASNIFFMASCRKMWLVLLNPEESIQFQEGSAKLHDCMLNT